MSGTQLRITASPVTNVKLEYGSTISIVRGSVGEKVKFFLVY